MSAALEPIVGHYMTLEIQGRAHRVYFEEAGRGIPLLCLHTAGGDARQFRAVLNDAALLERFRVIAFDLPRHGKSSPPTGWEREEYRLTTEAYLETVMAVVDGLDLDRPVVMGCSIGGRAVLHLAIRHPDRFRAAIGLQSGASAGSVWSEHFKREGVHYRLDVHGGEVCAALVGGIMSPSSPSEHRWETLWHYAQSGPGIFEGDIHYYLADGDVTNELGLLDTARCPLFLLSGDYDYSAPPAAARAIAEAVPGTRYTRMEGLGHFPMSEDPDRFLTYLRPVLDEIQAL